MVAWATKTPYCIDICFQVFEPTKRMTIEEPPHEFPE